MAYNTLDEFFSESVHRHCSRPALFANGQYLSYGELDALCKRIECTLLSEGLLQAQRNVGLIYSKTPFSYAAVIAIMRSGNVYVPLSAKLPAARLLQILDDAAIDVVIVDGFDALSNNMREALLQSKTLRILTGDFQLTSIRKSRPQVPQLPSRRPEGLAYILHTSGSTGAPKGVAITHASACRCIEKLHRMLQTHELDRFSQFSSLSFDVSIADMFLCWKSGGSLHVPAAAEALVTLDFARHHQITVWSSVPSLASFLSRLRLLGHNVLPRVRLSMFAGEALPVELAQAWTDAAPRSRVFNLYGPTECTIFATSYEYKRQESFHNGVVPIGFPLSGLRYMIVSEGRVVRDDETIGELWLAGDQLAYGYWNNPVETRKAFVPCPELDPAADIWYRTGDLVSQRTTIGLLFHGRVDRQIKLRGFRVELQEIEAVLREVIGCTMVAVVPLPNAGILSEKIVAYCDTLPADERTIKARCRERMLPYMVPDRILELEAFPLSESGKINYCALTERTLQRPD